jgi:hypothetical protein
VAVRVMGFFLGTLRSLLRFPRGVGGVEGGVISASVAFGFPMGSAVVAVLAYRDLVLAPDAAWHRRVSGAALDGPRMASGRHQARRLTPRRAGPSDFVR